MCAQTEQNTMTGIDTLHAESLTHRECQMAQAVSRGLRNRDGDCVRPSRRLAGRRRCRLFVPDGTLVRSAPQGAIRITFSGRVGRRALRPGRYRAGLTAAIGGRSAKPTVLTFRIVR